MSLGLSGCLASVHRWGGEAGVHVSSASPGDASAAGLGLMTRMASVNLPSSKGPSQYIQWRRGLGLYQSNLEED